MELKEDTDLIDIKALISLLWNRKYFISSLTFFGAIFSIFFALAQNNIYQSTAVLKPSQSYLLQGGNGLNSLISQSPISLLTGSSEVDDKISFSLEKMQNLDFFRNLYEKENFLIDLYAPKKWDPKSGEIIYNDNIYDFENKNWIRKVSNGPSKPSMQEAHRTFNKSNFFLSYDEKKNFITLSVNHISPKIAENWNNFIVDNINREIKEYDLQKTKNELIFLQENINLSDYAAIRDSMAFLMTQKINKLALIESSPNYVYEYVQKAYVPEKKFGPSRALICISITISFFIISILLSSLMNIYSINLSNIKNSWLN